jgi:N-acetylglutamate synthase-like GNAT family acetyltransferase
VPRLRAIRRATQADQAAITALVRGAGINPFGLRWQRFLVADDGGRVIGTVQIKPHGDGSRELASLAVVPELRGRGVGSDLMQAMLANESGTLYLTCRDHLEGYYARFGFRRLERAEMPRYFRRLSIFPLAIGAVLGVFGQHFRILVMAREEGVQVPRSISP